MQRFVNSYSRLFTFLFTVALLSQTAFGKGLDKKTRAKCQEALAEGAKYLIESQNQDGSWGDFKHPALSGLAAMGMHKVSGVENDKRDDAVEKAMDYVIKYVSFPKEGKPKGGKYYPNYTAAIALLAMTTIDNPDYIPHMKRARQYLQDLQFKDKNTLDYGGIGYGKTKRADLSNSSWALQAMHFTDHLDKEPHSDSKQEREEAKKTYKRMRSFLTKAQNLPETNDEPYVSEHEDDLGGFVYRPNESKAGEREMEAAEQNKLISSGSMTYAGLLSMIYSKFDIDDIRVRAALDYSRRHYTVEENPGMGRGGYYYYLHIMSKALDAFGKTYLKLEDGTRKNWRKDIAQKLLEQQQENGSWQNENGRFMESLPSLVTSYNLVTLKILLGEMSFAE